MTLLSRSMRRSEAANEEKIPGTVNIVILLYFKSYGVLCLSYGVLCLLWCYVIVCYINLWCVMLCYDAVSP
jgi:hypothetical protein